MAKKSLTVSVDEEVVEQIKNDPTLSQTEIFEVGWEHSGETRKSELRQLKEERADLEEQKEELQPRLTRINNRLEKIEGRIEELESTKTEKVELLVESMKELWTQGGYGYNHRSGKRDNLPRSVPDLAEDYDTFIQTQNLEKCWNQVVKGTDEFDEKMEIRVEEWAENQEDF